MALLALVVLHARALAVPPPAVAMSAAGLPIPHWIEHSVIPGERLSEIAKRYDVTIAKLLEWNQLDEKKVFLRAGQHLRVWTNSEPATRRYRRYPVKDGDNWTKVAKRFDVDVEKLHRAWNPSLGELRAGDKLDMWVEVEPTHGADREPPPRAPTPAAAPATASASAPKPKAKAAPEPEAFDFDFGTDPDTAAAEADGTDEDEDGDVFTVPDRSPSFVTTLNSGLRGMQPGRATQPQRGTQPARGSRDFKIIGVPKTAFSVGQPAHGRLKDGLQLPSNDALYTIRNPEHSWGSSHMIEELQRGLANFRRATGFDRRILIEDMSQHGGGRFGPHKSHRSGRDVDIQLPVRAGLRQDIVPDDMSLVDWDATWAMIKGFVSTGQIRYIFLSRSRQVPLYRAAQRAGASEEEIKKYLQYPHGEAKALVRHSSGHVKHIHVRFICAEYEPQCAD
jgi:murein endopeptidase